MKESIFVFMETPWRPIPIPRLEWQIILVCHVIGYDGLCRPLANQRIFPDGAEKCQQYHCSKVNCGFVILCDVNNVSSWWLNTEAEAWANLIEKTTCVLPSVIVSLVLSLLVGFLEASRSCLYECGAYGGEIAHILQSCQVFTRAKGEIETLSAKDLAFG